MPAPSPPALEPPPLIRELGPEVPRQIYDSFLWPMGQVLEFDKPVDPPGAETHIGKPRGDAVFDALRVPFIAEGVI